MMRGINILAAGYEMCISHGSVMGNQITLHLNDGISIFTESPQKHNVDGEDIPVISPALKEAREFYNIILSNSTEKTGKLNIANTFILLDGKSLIFDIDTLGSIRSKESAFSMPAADEAIVIFLFEHFVFGAPYVKIGIIQTPKMTHHFLFI